MADETNLLEESNMNTMDDAEFEAALAKVDLDDDVEVTKTDTDEDEDELANDEDKDEDVVDVTDSDDKDESDDEEELEQPTTDEDSDDDSDDDDDEEDSDEDSDEADVTADATDEQTTDDDTKTLTEPQAEQTYKYKANGEEFEFTEKEVKEQFGEMFSKAMNYTQKMQAMAKYRGVLTTLREQDLGQEDLNLMIDVLKGDKDATAALLKRTGVDALDLEPDEDKTYQPNNYGRSETELDVMDVTDQFANDPEFTRTADVVTNTWDNKSRQEFATNPKLIAALHTDVKSGVYDRVSPMATKLKVLDGGMKSDLEYYKEAGAQYYQAIAQQEQQQVELAQREQALAAKEAELAKIESVKAKEAKRAAKAKASKKRRAAGTTGTTAGKPDALDYMDMDAMSDDEFSEFMEKLSK